jgi:hypothetical protein
MAGFVRQERLADVIPPYCIGASFPLDLGGFGYKLPERGVGGETLYESVQQAS